MLLRVRGNGACPENSQAVLVYLRGFRLTNTQPPPGNYNLDGVVRPLRYPHFHVGIQTPGVSADEVLGEHLCHVVWKEIWNMYDILYDELCLFPGVSAATGLLSSLSSSCSLEEEREVANDLEFTQLTARFGAKKAVVVTHHFQGDGVRRRAENVSAEIVVLDVSAVPLVSAAKKIAVEVAWVAAYASLQGVLDHAAWIVVRLPYVCNISAAEKNLLVQEGLDFLGEHLTLLVRRFASESESNPTCSMNICFIGSSSVQLQETLVRLRSWHQAAGNTSEEKKGEGGVFIFSGDHHQHQLEQELQCVASLTGGSVRLELVPLRNFLEGHEEHWDAETTRENQVLNFCPCCGHCCAHES